MMLKIENVEVTGWEHAIRGMRNPKNSWEKSDSGYHNDPIYDEKNPLLIHDNPIFNIGPNDQKLMMTLRDAGTDHRKFMRMITVYLDITAPLYWWKEFDTYKVGTVADSCSTMHKIYAKEFTRDDFSHEHLNAPSVNHLKGIINRLNRFRNMYLHGGLTYDENNNYVQFEPKNKYIWWQMIQLLPSSYNQKRTVMLNYEVLANMYKSRKDHKLDEWLTFCDWMETLPHSELITGNATWSEWSEQDLYKIAIYIQTNDPRITNSNSYVKVATNHNICNFVVDDKVLYSFDMARVTVKVATDFIRDNLNDMFKDFSKAEIISDDNSIQIQERMNDGDL